MQTQTINPTTEQILASYQRLNEAEVAERITMASQSFQQWSKTDFAHRRQLMLTLAKTLRDRQNQYATLMAQEMGKPISAGISEIHKCAWVCEYYAEHAETYLAPQIIKTELQKSMVVYQPLGVIFAIMPWNFPFWQVFRFAAPHIMSGNAALLKHAAISTGSGNAIMELFIDAGFPTHLFQHLVIDHPMAAKVIAHPKVAAVTLTGSEQAGASVAANAAQHLKKAVLELGGNDPYIVLADADLDLAAKAIVASRLNNNGQTCIAAKRIIVLQPVLKALLEKIIAELKSYPLGDPLDPTTKLGPLARGDLRKTLHQQVTESIAKGAKLHCGGVIPSGIGYYYPPTVLTNVSPGMPAFDDELFGPVIAIMAVNDEDEAIHLANQSRYGLGAAIFTRDLARGEQLATHAIEAGTCFVNGYVASDPRLPFGGIKHSGFGRELAREGILEFVNIKTVGIHDHNS